jgi:hypothetical protein
MAQTTSWFTTKQKTNYSYKGRKNKTEHKEFVALCKMPQMSLKEHLAGWLKDNGYEVINEDGFLYARGDVNVLLTAHMDTVHKTPVKDFYEYKEKDRTIISSPQGIGGDDRCGVWMIKEVVACGLKPYILFCEEEEVGGIGSDKFVKSQYLPELKEMMLLIECDRANSSDLVFYDDENELFHDWCEQQTNYLENWGSFSDISNLSPACGIAGVNISCGYYNAHTTDEYVVFEEMWNSSRKVIDLVIAAMGEGKSWEYIEKPRHYWNSQKYYEGLWGDYMDGYTQTKSKQPVAVDLYGTVTFSFILANEEELTYSGESFYSCVANLMISNPTLSWNDIYDYYQVEGIY